MSELTEKAIQGFCVFGGLYFLTKFIMIFFDGIDDVLMSFKVRRKKKDEKDTSDSSDSSNLK